MKTTDQIEQEACAQAILDGAEAMVLSVPSADAREFMRLWTRDKAMIRRTEHNQPINRRPASVGWASYKEKK